MKRVKLLLGAALLVVCNLASGATYSGKAGDNAYYELDTQTGLLRIYGSGDTYNRHAAWWYFDQYKEYDASGNGKDNGNNQNNPYAYTETIYSGSSPIYNYRSYIKTVVIEEGITSIGAGFFYKCSNITSISTPSTLKLINYESIRGCSSLTSFNIGPNVEKVMARWATDCTNLSYISVDAANENFVSVGGVLYTSDLQILVRFPEALNTIEYVIPEGTVYAATDALYKLSKVQSITIPTSMVDIEYGSFDQCPSLKTLVLKASTPPTLHKNIAGTKLSGIYVPCGEAATYTANGNWNSYSGGHVTNAVVVEFYVETNNPVLGDVDITSRADCEGYQMTIMAVPTQFGLFSHWEDDNSTSLTRVIDINKDDLSRIYRYKAIFNPKPYKVTLEKGTEILNDENVYGDYQVSATMGSTTITTTGNNTSVASDNGTFHYGDTLTLYCDVDGSKGLNFFKWRDGNTDNPRTVVITENTFTGKVSYKAEIQRGDVTIKTKTNNQSHGTVSPASQTVPFGTSVTITASPKEDYQLRYWSDEPENQNPSLSRTFIATASKTYTAYFFPITYTITASSNNSEWGTCTGGATLPKNGTTTLVATPNEHYEFVEWNDGTTTASYTVTATQDKNYVATFRPKKYAINFKNDDGTTLKTEMVEYNTMPVYTGSTPTKAADAQYTYTYSGWTPALTAATGPTDYIATYSNTLRSYTITFKNYDGTVLATPTVNYGVVPSYNGTTPTKPATAQYSYTYSGWTPTVVSVTENAEYTATYNSTVNKYAIKFINGGSVLQNSEWEYNATPVYSGATPTKAATAEWTYSFKAWSPTISKVTGAQEYSATFNQTKNKYTILFKNEDGTTLLTLENQEYGTTPVYTAATPTKAATAEYSYSFKSWDSEITSVTGAKTYTATYNATKNKYHVIYKNYNGEELQNTEVEYGIVPSYNGATPTKPNDAQYTYTFSGWNPKVVAVKGEATYTAQFSTANTLYDIDFVNWDGSPLTTTQKYALNEIPSFDGTPTRPASAQYTYTFSGWSPAISAVDRNQTYTATYNSTINKYDITFIDDDNSVLKTVENVEYGTTPSYGGTPTKASTAQYSYTFAGWTPAITTVTGAATYKATYNSTTRSYTITFANIDGNGGNQTQTKNYGEMPDEPATPTKAETAEYSYTFDGWDKPINSVTGEATYTAQFKGTKKKYTIKFVNADGTQMQSSDWEYGTIPSYTGATPAKEADAQYTYTWSNGWDKTITAVTEATTYTATFISNLRSYTISFVNDDNSLLKSYVVEYGSTPAYDGNTPTKPETEQYIYTWDNGWNPEITSVTGNATYKATYNQTLHPYTVRFLNYDGTELKTYTARYGDKPSIAELNTPERTGNAQYSYTFSGWSPSLETTITGNTDFTAQFNEVTNAYTITFVNYNGETLYESDFLYGVTPTYNGEEPQKPSNEANNYSFTGWSPLLKPVTGTATYTAQFSSEAVLYTITFKDYDGTIINTEKYGYNATITHADLSRPQDDQNTYTFAGWSPAFAPVTTNAEYTATYTSTLRQYNITFIDGNGNSQVIPTNYGELPAAPATSTKTATDKYTYTFTGWQPGLVSVTGAATYTAQFNPVIRKYTITFIDFNDDEITHFDVAYDETPSIDAPVRAADAQYTYAFRGWNPTIAPVTGTATYKAEYTPTLRSYTITVLSNDNTMGFVSGYGTFNYGEETAISATAQTGYHFERWNDENTKSMRTITVSGNADYTAIFAPNTNTEYTLNIYTQNIENDDYQFETRTMTGTTNQLSTYSAPAIEGFDLQNYEQVNVNGDGSAVLNVYYNRNSYDLSWNTNGGNDLTGTYTNGSVKFGAPITQPTPERTGFIFTGWQPNLATMPAENIECMAQWTEKGDTPYTIEHYLQNLDSEDYTLFETDNTNTGKTNTMTSVAANNYPGFAFERKEDCNINADGSGVAKVYYTRNSYSLKWIVDGTEITEGCTNGNILFDSPITAPQDPEKAGYIFDGWGTTVASTMPAENTEYVAQWAVAENTPYIVMHFLQKLNSSYSAMPDQTDTLQGTTGTTTAATAMLFDGFTAESFEQGTIAADGSTCVSISYKRNAYTLTWIIGEASIGEAEYTEGGEVLFGTPIIAPVVEKMGYTHHWDTLPATMPSSNLTCTALWTASNSLYYVYHMQQCLDGEYSVISEPEMMFGKTDTLTQAVAKDYEGFTPLAFSQGTISAQGTTIVEIRYSRNSYELTWNLDGGTANTDSCTAGIVLFGTPIVAPDTLTKQGYSFAGWSIDIPTTMPAQDLTLTAQWEAATVPYTVEHYRQNIDGSYPEQPYKIDSLSGTTGNNATATDRKHEGFQIDSVQSATIAADGSSVVKVYYARNKYTLTWNLEGETPINDNYTKAGQVAYGTPIVAPQFMEKDYTSYSWDTLPETMPADNLTCKLIIMVEDSEIPERISFTVPATFVTCDDRHIEATNIIESNTKFTWSVNGVVDESQTGASFDIPEDAAPTGTITVTGYIGGSSWTEEIQYTVKRRIITTMWDDVITVDNTTGNYESYNWYHNGELVSDKAYYQEIGGLTGNYYLTAVTIDGVEINSCEETFEEPQTTAITAYPNPTTDKVIVKSGKMNAGDRLIVTDSNGKIWKTETVSNPAGEEFDLSNLPQGSYTISAGGESINIIKL